MIVLACFRSGKVIRYRITFPEGLCVKEWLADSKEGQRIILQWVVGM